MKKIEAIKLIDDHKNKMIDPVAMLHWSWLRVIVLQIPEAEWERYLENAIVVLSR